MLRSDNALGGVSIKVSKQADGSYVATPLGEIGKVVGPISGRNESEATNLCKQALNKAAETGKI